MYIVYIYIYIYIYGFGMPLGGSEMLKHLYIIECICYMAMKESLAHFMIQADCRIYPNPQPCAVHTTACAPSLQGTALISEPAARKQMWS